jgi:hypothetical protein
MAAATNLDKVKAITRKDPNIQALVASDGAVVFALELAEEMAPLGKFKAKTEAAQTYLVAHILSVAFTVAGGQGPLSSESVGGITQSFTLPYLNQQTVIASTQYGLMYLEMVRSMVVPIRSIRPA